MIRWTRTKLPDGTFRTDAWQVVPNADQPGVGDSLRRVASVVLTGRTGVDNYPWDWYLAEGVESRTRRSAGPTDTLRSAKWAILDALGEVDR